MSVTSNAGLPLATKHTRVVHGGRGSYLEMSDDDIITENIHIPQQAAWRQLPKYSYVYYDEYRSNCGSQVKLYLQRKCVDYADYLIGFWYASVNDVLFPPEPQDAQ